MLGVHRTLVPVLAAGAIVLLLCGTLCLFDDDTAGLDLCLVVLAAASAALVMLALEPAGRLVPALSGTAYLTPAESRSPPPKR